MADLFPDALRHAGVAHDSLRATAATMPARITTPAAHDTLGEFRDVLREMSRALSWLSAALSGPVVTECDAAKEIDLLGVRERLTGAESLLAMSGDLLRDAQNLMAYAAHRDRVS